MARRRRLFSRASSKSSVSRLQSGRRVKNKPSRGYMSESLEQRLMFVVLHGGDVFEFYADNSHYERVVVSGNTTVELIGARVGNMTGQLTLVPMDGVIFRGPDAGTVGIGFINGMNASQTTLNVTDDIYTMYVSQADLTSRIAVAAVPDLQTPVRPMLPFNGSIGQLRVIPTAISGGGPLFQVNAPDGTGNALLGARTVSIQNNPNNNIPILGPEAIPPATFTTLPPTITSVSPGLIVAPGNNLDQFLFAGTILGNVNVHGSVNLFYAGWLLTGNANGEFDVGIVSNPHNFNVDGDVRTLRVSASIGTDTDAGVTAPKYVSGFDMHVGGVLGKVWTSGSLIGNVDVTHSPSAPTISGTPYTELELRGPGGFDPFDVPEFGADPGIITDSFAAPEYLGMTDNAGNIVVNGILQDDPVINDAVDYYAVPLMAGQTITAQVSELATFGLPNFPGFVGLLSLGIFDPDGRLVATDYNRVDPSQLNEQAFQFTADRPGSYRFAIAATVSNTNFAGGPATTPLADIPYQLKISNVGNLGFGAIVATTNILGNPSTPFINGGASFGYSYHVANGDFGAAEAGGEVINGFLNIPGTTGTTGGFASYTVDNGNLRVVQGGSVGHFVGGGGTDANGNPTGIAFGAGPTGFVPHGSVGLIEADTPNRILSWNDYGLGAGLTLTQAQSSAMAIGGDYQVLSAAGTFLGDIIADGNIGTIRANDMVINNATSYFQVNASNSPSRRGIIDLIDVKGNMGTLGVGGPAIVTGPNGDCRYIHVGGVPFRDIFFGGGSPEQTTYQPGETATITDDSGTLVTIAPDLATTTLTVTTYPIRGSGGSAIVKVESTNGVAINAGGAGSAEIGDIQVDGTGQVVVNNNTTETGGGTTPTTGNNGAGTPGGPPVTTGGTGKFKNQTLPAPPTLSTTGTAMSVTLTGTKLDIYEISSSSSAADGSVNAGLGRLTAITNSSGGEIVNMHVTSVGAITMNGQLGLAETNTASAVLGLEHVPLSEDAGQSNPWDAPFIHPRNLVRILGNVVSITANGGIGNLYVGRITMVGGSDPALVAFANPPVPASLATIGIGVDGNVGSITTIGQILGPIVSAGSIGAVTCRGIGWYGSGAVGRAGIYSAGMLGPVVVNGVDRGAIISSTGQVADTINGTLDQAEIGNFTRFDFAESRAFVYVIRGALRNNPITLPTVDLGSVTINGNGGMIGTGIYFDHGGPITVGKDTFGVFDSLITTPGEGTMSTISAGGYGFRDGTIRGGANLGSIVATGSGALIPVTNFPATVRQSESGLTFDPVTGAPLGPANDISGYLGASASNPTVVGVTDSGVMEDLTVQGSRDLANLSAWSIRGRVINVAVLVGLIPPGAIIPNITNVNLGNSIGNISVVGPVNGMSITTGRTGKFKFGGSVAAMNLTVAGVINNLVFNSSLLSSSSISAVGPNGKIGRLMIHGNMDGTISATSRIQQIDIDGSLTGTVKAASLGTLKLGGGIGSGSLLINGNVGSIITKGDLGTLGQTLTINGTLNLLKVGGNVNSNVTVSGDLKQIVVTGSIISGSTVSVANTITLLKVGNDIQAGAVVKAHLIKKRIIGGQLLGSIITT